jgi:hypothetical protein
MTDSEEAGLFETLGIIGLMELHLRKDYEIPPEGRHI